MKRACAVCGSLLLVMASGSFAAGESTVEELQREISDLKARLADLEALVANISAPRELRETAVLPAEKVAEVELAQAQPEADTAAIELGGALRFNVIHREDVDSSEGKRGESGLDVFRLNVDGAINNLLLSAEYRFYPYMDTIRYGWVGYQFEDDSVIQAGINQVPFGLLPYAAHNAWFGVPYYVGMADDYDMGVKYQREDGPWSGQVAFYKNEELNDAGNLDRYSYDLVLQGDQQNEEINQLNARLAYTFGKNTTCETELGGSLEAGQVYNNLSDERGDHRAYALHLDSRCGRWNFQLQGARYDYEVPDPPGVDDRVVRFGAFAGAYDVAAAGKVYVANVAYNFASPWRYIDSLTCYNDYSLLDKSLDGASDSQINTLGCAIGSGPLFTYVDYILARNMPFFGDGSLAGGGEDDWLGRLNINIGYYW
ncbi:porin [Parahaliea aestuarii]|uniref:Carbohydrate porin n=1 Tax=Parahaliea aestuarii TaxID=1852021 RepID=A0A5C8ZZY4_9GAMM|nr:porin [Parahaliea aestuarii]TXS93294.1 hypothetical protein FVW59_05485 [Parahaliea aestuarii]